MFTIQSRIEDWKTNCEHELKLNYLRITDIPEEIMILDQPLAKLSLAANELSSIPLSFTEKHSKLSSLELSANKFDQSKDNNNELYKSLSSLKHLEKLYFSENKVDNSALFIKSISFLQELRYLELREFNMGVHVGPTLSEISKMTQITSLILSECDIKGFPTILCSLHQLKTLDLSFNSFTIIPNEISKLISLEYLRLDGCNISLLDNGISELVNLEGLLLNYNEIISIPPEIVKLTKLVQLQLLYNNISEYPSCILDMSENTCLIPSLQSLQLHGNLIPFEGNNDNFIKLKPSLTMSANPSRLMRLPNLIIEPQELGDSSKFHGIYLGSYNAAKNKHYLEELGIKAILIVGSGLFKLYPNRFEYLQYHIDDAEGEELFHFFDEGTQFIHKERTKGAVFVHCAAGISRSASLVIAYLIRFKKMSYESAYKLVKSKRDGINPNKSFVEQLKIYADKSKHSKCTIM